MDARVARAATLLLAVAAASLGAEDEVRIGAGVLRAYAVHVPLPEYPARLAAAGKEGKVTAELAIGADGSVANLDIIEFTDEAFGGAVLTALKQWTFGPVRDGEGRAVRATGALTFLFRIISGKPAVVDEADEVNKRQRRQKI